MKVPRYYIKGKGMVNYMTMKDLEDNLSKWHSRYKILEYDGGVFVTVPYIMTEYEIKAHFEDMVPAGVVFTWEKLKWWECRWTRRQVRSVLKKRLEVTPKAKTTANQFRIFERIAKILKEQSGVAGEVHADDVITEKYGYDSLDEVELVMAIEEEFDLEIPDEDIVHVKTVGDICKFLESRVS